jgi:hypothetical protein
VLEAVLFLVVLLSLICCDAAIISFLSLDSSDLTIFSATKGILVVEALDYIKLDEQCEVNEYIGYSLESFHSRMYALT